MECTTPPPSSAGDVIVECVGPLTYVEYPAELGWLAFAAVIGPLVFGRRRYPGLTPILVGVLVVLVGLLALVVLASVALPGYPVD